MSAIIMYSTSSSEAPISNSKVRRISSLLTSDTLLLQDDLDSYRYLKASRKSVQGVNDVSDFATLRVTISVG